MSYQTLQISVSNHIAHIQLNRPDELNTMNPAFWRELPEVLRDIDQQGEARVVVLSSTGKHFTAGMDLSVFGGGLADEQSLEAGRRAENLRRKVLQLQAIFNLLEEIRVPVLAAIQGGCIGGGVDMVSACDSRYCTADAFFSIKETNIGMTADLGTLQRLPHLMPHGLVRELAYTGRRLTAEEALSSGLVNTVYPDHQTMLDGVMAIAADIAQQSPLAITGTKTMLNYSRDHSVADSLLHMAAWQGGMFQPTDMLESFTAQGEKRPPQFENLQPIKPPIPDDT